MTLKSEREHFSSTFEELDDSFISHFPLNNLSMFNTVESQVKNDSSFLKKW